jgi:hypothetical protein
LDLSLGFHMTGWFRNNRVGSLPRQHESGEGKMVPNFKGKRF